MDFSDNTIIFICSILLLVLIVIYIVFPKKNLEESMVPSFTSDLYNDQIATSLPLKTPMNGPCCGNNEVYADITGKDQFFTGFDTPETQNLSPFLLMDGGINGTGKSYFSSFPDEIKCDRSADYIVPMGSMCVQTNLDGTCPKRQQLVCGLTPHNLRKCHWK